MTGVAAGGIVALVQRDGPFRGSLFGGDFLAPGGGVTALEDDWGTFNQDEIRALEADLRAVFEDFPAHQSPNEVETEHRLI